MGILQYRYTTASDKLYITTRFSTIHSFSVSRLPLIILIRDPLVVLGGARRKLAMGTTKGGGAGH